MELPFKDSTVRWKA